MPATPRCRTDLSAAPRLRRHRVRLLDTLARICGHLEELQPEALARQACRDVRRQLEAWRRREDTRTSARRGS